MFFSKFFKETIENDALQPEIKTAIDQKIAFLREQGHTVEAVDFPLLSVILPTYYILTTAEASSNLSRYDGVKYGFRSKNAENLEQMYKKTRSEGFGQTVNESIMLGTFVLSASYYDAYYTKAQKVRRLIQEKTEEIFKEYSFILSPNAPTTAPKFGSFSEDPIQMYLADIFSVQANVVGMPAISIPCGKDNENMPIGLQIMADFFEEEKLMSFSDYLMKIFPVNSIIRQIFCKLTNGYRKQESTLFQILYCHIQRSKNVRLVPCNSYSVLTLSFSIAPLH